MQERLTECRNYDQAPPQTKPKAAGSVGIQVAERKPGRRPIFNGQPREVLLHKPGTFITEIDDWLVIKLVIPTPRLVCRNQFMEISLDYFSTRSRSYDAHIDMQTVCQTQATVLPFSQ